MLYSAQREDECGTWQSVRRSLTYLTKYAQQWIPITINLSVHILMCEWLCNVLQIMCTNPTVDYYYYATAGGAKIWVCLLLVYLR